MVAIGKKAPTLLFCHLQLILLPCLLKTIHVLTGLVLDVLFYSLFCDSLCLSWGRFGRGDCVSVSVFVSPRVCVCMYVCLYTCLPLRLSVYGCLCMCGCVCL